MFQPNQHDCDKRLCDCLLVGGTVTSAHKFGLYCFSAVSKLGHARRQVLLTSMQDDGWVKVTRRSRCRHMSAQQNKQLLPCTAKAQIPQAPLPSLCNQTTTATPTKSIKAKQTPSTSLIHSTTLSSLPAMVLACIFQHLDFISSCNLGKTCRSLAAEFALHRADFVGQCRRLLLPSIIRDCPRIAFPYGTDGNPVLLHVKWADPGSALRLMYELSQQPGFMNQLWGHAWPEKLWSDLVADNLSPVWPRQHPVNYYSDCKLHIIVNIELASNEPLRLPWDWLAQFLLQPPATGLIQYLQATTLQLTEDFEECLHWTVRLTRPAQAGQSQEVMFKGFPPSSFPFPYHDEDDACTVYSFLGQYAELFYLRPRHMQKVAITGHWCQELPEPDALWYAQCGHLHDLRCMAVGDDIAADVRSLADDLGVPDIGMQSSLIDEVQEVKPFTCEVPDSLEWRLKRQQAKRRGNVKRTRAAKRDSRGVSSRADGAKWLYDSIHDMSLTSVSSVR